MQQKKQMSDSIRLGILLALSGGFMDAYSYLGREKVFANAQTGNLLLLGVNLSEGNFSAALRYFCPVLAFTVGIVLADLIRYFWGKSIRLHWRQISLLCEAAVLFCVGFLPQEKNLLANSLISLSCGIQVESFRKIHGNGIATTMCIGNLRSGTQNLFDYVLKKKQDALRKGILYYGMILCFAAGAVLGAQVLRKMQERAIFVSVFLLMVSFFMMFMGGEEKQK